MKKITLLGSALFLSIASFAQSELVMNNTQNKTSTGTSIEMSRTDGVIMKNGTMKTIKNGQMSTMASDFTCKDGTRITTGGVVFKKDGSQTTLKEGQYLDTCGKVMSVSNSSTTANKNNSKTKEKTMYLVPDSTLKNK